MFYNKKEPAEERFDFRILAVVIMLCFLGLTAVVLMDKRDNTLVKVQKALKCSEEKAQEITDYLADNNITHIQEATKYDDYLLLKITDIASCKLYLNSELDISFIIKSTSEIPESEELESDEDSLNDEPGVEKWYYHQGDWYPEDYDE